MDLALIERIKKLAIVALVSDDYLMEQLVLKGGNAIDLIYQISGRASMDLDFSMAQDFDRGDLHRIKDTVRTALTEIYEREGLVLFDFRFSEQPERIGRINKAPFWGGYVIEFKLITKAIYERYSDNMAALRKRSTVIDASGKTVLRIDISKFECCTGKEAKQIEGYTVYVYTTEMIVLEKIRTICQQHPEYRTSVKSHAASARARDFFDIYTIMQTFPVDFDKPATKELLRAIFDAKQVPLRLIREVASQKDSHSADYPSLKDTVKEGVELQPFDYYFDYVVGLVESIDI
jgi:predicted nucleotidyltransferase component of viral defense system